MAGAFTGSHVAQPQVSVWLQLLRQVRNGLANGTLALAPAETASVRDFLSLVDTQIDAEAFEAKMDIVRRATMTDWDQRIHMLYGYVYRDTHAGADPLLPLKFANQGNGIKRAVGLYPFDRRPDFPHEEPHGLRYEVLRRQWHLDAGKGEIPLSAGGEMNDFGRGTPLGETAFYLSLDIATPLSP
ncbi:hypothetical protein LZK73_32495 (plasmid) [Neorhizobium galegae]|nr:hypothetical protein LZK73_32495 [Neorhizobium galegae]